MPGFDVEGAIRAGHSKAEIADYLAADANFNTAGARAAGYSDDEIISHLTGAAPAAPKRMNVQDEQAILGQINDPKVAPDAIVSRIKSLTGSEVPVDSIIAARDQARKQGAKVAGFNYEAPGAVGLKTQEPDNSWPAWLGHKAQVTANALSPYATAASAGGTLGLAGGPFAEITVPAGATIGTTGLALGDLGATGYNALANLWHGKQLTLPSDVIRQQMQKVGVGEEPRTTGERIFSAGVEGAAGGLTGATSANRIAEIVNNPTARRVLTVLGEQPKAQTLAGAGSAASGQSAREADLSPNAQLAASVLGSIAGGRMGAAKPETITPEMLKQKSQASYKAAENAGVNVSNPALINLTEDLSKTQATRGDTNAPKFDADFHKGTAEALDILKRKTSNGQPMSIADLEDLRSNIRNLKASNPTDQALIERVNGKIDDFMHSLKPEQTTGGDAATAMAHISDARDNWRRMRQTEVINGAIENATNSASGLNAASIRNEFKKIADNPNRLKQFDADTQAAISDLARGKGGLKQLQAIGKMAPGVNLKSALAALAVEGGAAATGHPGLGGLAALGVGTGAVAKGAANRMAKNRAAAISNALSGTPNFQLPTAQIGIAAASQATKKKR